MRALSSDEKREKLRKLARAEGFPFALEMLKAATLDSVSPAICTETECDYTTEMEPDQDAGYCELCRNNTVASALILAGLI